MLAIRASRARPIIVRIKIRIVMALSWNMMSRAIIEEDASCRLICPHNDIIMRLEAFFRVP